jgi:ribonuclease R
MTQVPTKGQVLQWISDNPALTSKRDIAKAFGIKGAARIDLKRVLRELEDEGHLQKRTKSTPDSQALPPVAVVEISGTDSDGDLFARPLQWKGEGAEPRILMQLKASDPAMGAGDQALVRLQAVKGESHAYEGRLIRRIGTNPKRILGIYRTGAEAGRIVPIDKGADREWRVPPGAREGAQDGELVEAEQTGPTGRMGMPRARVIARLGDPGAAKAVSLIAIHQHGIPDHFPDAVMAEADAATPVDLGVREDLRTLSLITIDPHDARDHDDACYAQADDDPKNTGGHIIWVAIADVAHYVPPGSGLDREAKRRGNSTYFPDRVVPMLPDRLSGDLCSLHEGVERPCIAVRMQIDASGEKLGQRFTRALMKSHASLHYEEVQAAIDGAPTDRTAPFLEDVLKPLYAAYAALKSARARRQPLDLDLPERTIQLSPEGEVAQVAFKDRLDAHRLIEEFMVLANVAAAEVLGAKGQALLYRAHEEPNADKLDALRDTAQASGFTLAKGQVLQTRHLNKLLHDAAESDFAELINISTLRSMTQAYYTPKHIGHFGLALASYAHFTSPIRRYADLIVHRGLIATHGWGEDGLTARDIEALEETGKAISDTERRSMVAERDTSDRYLAAYLSNHVGAEFSGRISGVQAFGVFVRLDETGADGLIPVRALGREYFRYDREAQVLEGSDTGMVITIGLRVKVKLAEAVPVTGGLTLELLEIDGTATKPGGARRGKGGGKGGGRHTAKRAKKSVKRRRAR